MSHLSIRFTTDPADNRTHTLTLPGGRVVDWQAFEQLHPFRAGLAIERRAINADRFDSHHPFLAWLLTGEMPAPVDVPPVVVPPPVDVPPPIIVPPPPSCHCECPIIDPDGGTVVPPDGPSSGPDNPPSAHAIPEPGTGILLAIGLAAIGARCWIRRRAGG